MAEDDRGRANEAARRAQAQSFFDISFPIIRTPARVTLSAMRLSGGTIVVSEMGSASPGFGRDRGPRGGSVVVSIATSCVLRFSAKSRVREPVATAILANGRYSTGARRKPNLSPAHTAQVPSDDWLGMRPQQLPLRHSQFRQIQRKSTVRIGHLRLRSLQLNRRWDTFVRGSQYDF
jgi:hypothetical protein